MPDPVKWWPRKQQLPRLTGTVIIDTWRGQTRVRTWPRRRGKPKSPAIIEQINFFKAQVRFFNYWAPSQRAIAEQWAKNTPLLARDVMVLAHQGKLIDIHQPDGTVITGRRPELHETMFQGARVVRTSNQSFPSSGEHNITWQEAAIDTFDFWNFMQPARLTIPEGVEIARLTFSLCTGNVQGRVIAVIRDKNGDVVAIEAAQNDGDKNVQATTGARRVEAGDFYSASAIVADNGNTKRPEALWFEVEVLQALASE